MATTQINENTNEIMDIHTEAHVGPHIPLIQGEQVWGPISNVTVTTILFLVIISVVAFMANKALKSNKKSRLKQFFLTFTKFFDEQLRDAFGDKTESRKYYGVVVGMFFIILFGNLLGLVIDWFGLSVAPSIFYYLRPMHSDLNTTLVLSVITVVLLLGTQVKSHGAAGMIKSYAFNYQGAGVMEKCINVFVGWLHAIGLVATLGSLSLRLFGNIFAGIVLIGVISYLMATATGSVFEIGRIAVIPFWFFEVFVALIQAIVFAFLMIAYFKGASEKH